MVEVKPLPRESLDELLAELYGSIRRLASRALRNERQPGSVQTSDLVHEAYLKLARQGRVRWDDRGKVLAAAAHVMRQILVDRARRRNAKKHAPRGRRVELVPALDEISSRAIDLVALDEVCERLAAVGQRQAQVVELRFFGGLTLDETAQALDVSVATVKRDWDLARAWLLRELS